MPLKNTLFTVIVVCGFFALGEILLAFAGVRPALSTDDPFFGFAGNVPLYVEAQAADGSIVMRTAATKIVLFNHQEFPKTRGDTACRIFCIGGHHLQRAISPFRVVLQLVAHLPRPKT